MMRPELKRSGSHNLMLLCSFRKELKSDVESRMETIIESLCLNGRLQAVLLINKGRQMFARTLSLANKHQQLYLLQNFFSALSTVSKKVPSNEVCFSPLGKSCNPFYILFLYCRAPTKLFGRDVTVDLLLQNRSLYLNLNYFYLLRQIIPFFFVDYTKLVFQMNESLLMPIFETFSHFSKSTLISFINSKLDFTSGVTTDLVIRF